MISIRQIENWVATDHMDEVSKVIGEGSKQDELIQLMKDGMAGSSDLLRLEPKITALFEEIMR